MKVSENIMGMMAAIEILDEARSSDINEVLDYLHSIDELFSTYKKTSEISRLNAKKLTYDSLSPEVKRILKLSEDTKNETKNYYDIEIEGLIDPSSMAKGYAMLEASKMLSANGYRNFYIAIGADIEVKGFKNAQPWRLALPNPENGKKVILVSNKGVATSGIYDRGMQIYDPIKKKLTTGIKSLTVIGPNIYEADRFSTACYAMGEKGMEFLEELEGLEGYMVTKDGKIIMTSNFSSYFNR